MSIEIIICSLFFLIYVKGFSNVMILINFSVYALKCLIVNSEAYQFSLVDQNDHSSVWPYGSRSMSSVPGSTSPSLVQRNTQNNRYQLGQQHSQHHRARGYPN